MKLCFVIAFSYFRTDTGEPIGADGEDWDSECYTESEIQAAYYQLSLPLESIVVVDTVEEYRKCMEHITKVPYFTLKVSITTTADDIEIYFFTFLS